MADKFIPLSVPNIVGNAEKYVLETIQTEWVSSVGSYVTKFEEEFAKYIGTKYAIAIVNGTAALHISLILSDVGQGDEVLMPNLTFVAPANAIKYCGASPIFLDSNWMDLGLDINKLEDFLNKETVFKDGYTINKTTKAKIKAIIPVHAQGYPVDMYPLLKLCDNCNITVIEDATESLGTEYKGTRTGNFSSMACFSFNGNKIITSGGGGMIVTDDKPLAEKAKHLSTTAKTDPVEYHHDEIGYNYRMVNVLAALGLAQLEMIDEFVNIKRKNFDRYCNLLDKSVGFTMHTEPEYAKANYWMYCLVKDEDNPINIFEMIPKFEENGVQVRPMWKLMTMLPMYSNCQSYNCDVSLDIYQRTLNIPCSTNLADEDMDRVIKLIHDSKTVVKSV